MTKIPDGWVLVPEQITKEMLAAVRIEGIDTNVALADAQYTLIYDMLLGAAPEPPADPEIATGRETPGIAGAMYRLLDRCDYREVSSWITSERIRGTPQSMIIGTLAATVASIVTQLAAIVARSQMHAIAQECMRWAASLVHKDVTELVAHKKAETVVQNRIRVVSDGE